MNGDLKVNKEELVMHKKGKISEEYFLGKSLGEGAFGQVRLATHKATKQTRAIKVIKKTKENIEEILGEIQILSKLSHPNIMQIYEIFEDKLNYFIVSEYCKGGELFEMISKKGNLSEKNAAQIMKQLLSGICYSHKNNIVHRDLKPENILLDDSSNKPIIKIIDWGSAKTFNNSEKMTKTEGTAYYIAPEVLKGNYTEKCDLWSCGVILYILLCGYPPFGGDKDTDEEIYACVLKGEYDFPEGDWNSVSDDAKDLINQLLQIDPQKRPSALEALEHKWLKIIETGERNQKLAKNVLINMKKFKKNRKLEQAAISFIANQLVSKEERNELMKQFQLWDKNGDGVLSREEIIEGHKKAYGKVDVNEIDNMINSIDLDGNGVIDYNEFLSCSINKEKILRKENLELCFKAFDVDNSGTISLDEIKKIFKNSNMSEQQLDSVKNILKEADANGDGEISFNEFKVIMMKFVN